jgi:hypothetical protein
VNNFNKFYEKAKIEEEILFKKKKALWEDTKKGIVYKNSIVFGAESVLFSCAETTTSVHPSSICDE